MSVVSAHVGRVTASRGAGVAQRAARAVVPATPAPTTLPTGSIDGDHRRVQSIAPTQHSLSTSARELQHLTGRRAVATSCTSADTSPSSSAIAAAADVYDAVFAAGPGPASTSAGVDSVFSTRFGTSWRVRPYTNSDTAEIIMLQTNSFHTSNPVPFLNTFTYNLFRAEVVDALKQKTKYSDPSVFQLLVAEEVTPDNDVSSSSSSRSSGRMVGVVEVSLMTDAAVLATLPPGSTEYAYISSMCVQPTLRRRGVAQALMAAAEVQAHRWRQSHLALHVYKDNGPAVQLYDRYGMRVLNQDPGWKAFMGDRVRLLMCKGVEVTETGREAEV